MDYLTPRRISRLTEITGDVHIPVRLASSKKKGLRRNDDQRVNCSRGCGTTGHDESHLVKNTMGSGSMKKKEKDDLI